jgi:acetyl-CoA carboxylase carboxyl transferase subunit alpha
MSTHRPLGFEEHLVALESKIKELQNLSDAHYLDISEEISTLTEKLKQKKQATYENLSPWQIAQVARHPRRPLLRDYIEMIFEDFVEIHGGRQFEDDKAIIGGMATFRGRSVMLIGHQKGRDTNENLERNFGMPHPEGYRKALRLMKLANKFRKPIILFIDTPGAYPGITAEERGQAEAIARNIFEMSFFKVPILSIVSGEGGSGGAVALGVADRILMLQHSIYSVISPEACASILWKDVSKAEEAASALKLTAPDLLRLGIINEVIDEPLGGAHRDHQTTGERVAEALERNLAELEEMEPEERKSKRHAHFRNIGVFLEGEE